MTGVLQKIRLIQFRNFQEVELEFGEGINAIIGRNAIGKTTLLEAIHLLSIGRSFRTGKLQELIKKGSSHFSVHAFFSKDGIDQTLSIFYDGHMKEIKHNKTAYTSFSPLLGLFPTVLYSPFDIELIHDSPLVRRRFLNILIAQENPLYVYYLTRYAKALTNRNLLLKRKDLTTIEVWEHELIKAAHFIQEKRSKAITKLSSLAKTHYQELSNQKETPLITYKPSLLSEETFATTRKKEMLFGHTLIGPHRDDLEIVLNKLPAKNYASEGQKRTLIAALKLAECDYLHPALFLVDDFGIHLDEERQKLFETKLFSRHQLFVTSPLPLKNPKQAFFHSLEKPPSPLLTLQ